VEDRGVSELWSGGAPPADPTMPVHVSIHDVSPAWSYEVEDALALCGDVGIRPALLVVPDFHGRAPLLGDPRFCGALRDLQARGHEMYLHGFYHRSGGAYDASTGGGRLAWLFAQHVASGGEAEMSDVSAGEGRRRVADGEQIFADAGLRVDGFVAPAWSMPRWLLPLLGERGFRFAEDHFHVYDPAARRSRPSVVLNWATRTPGRLISSVAWCRAARHARAFVPARLAIHPADMRHLLVRREIERLLRWARDHTVARGTDLLT
jgi:predicted deacetylase